MLSVDELEKLETYPRFNNYIKKSFDNNILIVLIILFLITSSLVTVLLFLILTLSFSYFLDRKIFIALQKRKEKKEKNGHL